jgi:ArsR family transcriptional regulator
MALSARQVVDVLRAAGEPTRLRILHLLAREELAVMELSQILDQSQPRVSRHLKLLTEAGLVERFPDGAWMFYRIIAPGPRRQIADQALGLVNPTDATFAGDIERLQRVRDERLAAAAAYFAQNAARWDELRSLYTAEADVEAAILEAAGPGPFHRLVDLGTGAGRMLQLLGPRARSTVGLDLSQQMLNIARGNVADAGLGQCELRHGDILATGLPDRCADLVVIHQVLHYLLDPAAALGEAARLVGEGGRLLIIDFAQHGLEFLRQAHQHRRLGFSDAEIVRWSEAAGLRSDAALTLPPAEPGGLTVKIWTAARPAEAQRSAA